MALLAIRVHPKIKKKPTILPPVRPNVGFEAEYRRKIDKIVAEMHDDVQKTILAHYRVNEPKVIALAHDAAPPNPPDQDDVEGAAAVAETSALLGAAIPANVMKAVIDDMARKWNERFDEGSVELARYFAQSTAERTTAQLKAILKKAGWAVPFEMTPGQADVIAGIVHENVALIKSIPQRYLNEVEQSVMRSVQIGRDVGGLKEDLQKHFNVSKNKAALIARDQNNKATAFLNRHWQISNGVQTAIWLHSHAGKQPRPTHVANDGKEFNVIDGWYDPHEQRWIQPGELINCRCMSRSILPGIDIQ